VNKRLVHATGDGALGKSNHKAASRLGRHTSASRGGTCPRDFAVSTENLPRNRRRSAEFQLRRQKTHPTGQISQLALSLTLTAILGTDQMAAVHFCRQISCSSCEL
jgi:hypothetical protein